MGKNWNKFKVLIWKNWILQYRHPVAAIFEILFPIFLLYLLACYRSLQDPISNPTKIYPEFSPLCAIPNLPFCPSELANSTSNASFFKNTELCLVYSPKNDIFDRSFSIFNLLPKLSVIGYNTSRQLETHFENNVNDYTIAGIQFDDSLLDKKQLPKDLKVNIRFPSELRINDKQTNNWLTNLIHPKIIRSGPRDFENVYGASPIYYSEGFLTLQILVSYILMIGQKEKFVSSLKQLKEIMKNIEIPDISMQRLPFSSWMSDPILLDLKNTLGFCITLGFFFSCINIIRLVTIEKEKQLKEAMKIMGLTNWLHWLAWFVKCFIFLFITIVFMVIVLKKPWSNNSKYSVLTFADPYVLLVFLTFYITATITFAFAVSTFFYKANFAVLIGALLYCFNYFLYGFVEMNDNNGSLFFELLFCLASNSALTMGFKIILIFEGIEEGIQWSNMFSPAPGDKSSVGLVMIMLAVDSLIYMLIALYVETVFPGEYGVPQPWYFPFTAQYWMGARVGSEDNGIDELSQKRGEFFEKEPTNMAAGIKIRGLRKVFGQKIAVENLTLNMYEDHITVLLGHNGAGKTTTMSMLTGMFPPTSGTAIISGYDIRTNIDDVRDSLGLCPQHNIIFDDLTVEEHLYFFSKLKGLKDSEINIEIDKFISLLELTDKANARASKLSGGMKRKLCVAIALCGNSKVVMLDEPTAGMDPSARRALWDFLRSQKQGRTILLSTHYMDEADLLGDRIAIMAGGELQCCGSSFFLKKKFGTGYHLIMEKADSCNPDAVTRLLKRYVSSIEIHSNVGSELSFLLPENQMKVFQNMLRDLENNAESLGVKSFGISLTTLEEVFLKVGAESFDKDEEGPVHHRDRNQHIELTMESVKLLTGWQLIKNQFLAMFMKKVVSTYRACWIQIIHILLLVFTILLAVYIKRKMVLLELPALELTLDSYDNPITLIKDNNSEFTQFYIESLARHKNSRVDNITSTMIKLTASSPSIACKSYIVGASFLGKIKENVEKINVWFNNNPYHSPPLALGLVLNSVYKKIMSPKHSIQFYNHPLPYTRETKIDAINSGRIGGNLVFAFVIPAMSFVTSMYILFYIRERASNSKHLQIVSGVKVYVFWVSSYIWDIVHFIMIAIAVIVTILCSQLDDLRTFEQLLCVFIIFAVYGIGMLPLVYFASFLFNTPSIGYLILLLFCLFTTQITKMVLWILSVIKTTENLSVMFLLLPNYSFSKGLEQLNTNYEMNQVCKTIVKSCVEFNIDFSENICWKKACLNSKDQSFEGYLGYCCSKELDYYKWKAPGLGRNIVFSLSAGLGLFILLLIKEYKIFTNFINKVINILLNKKPTYVEDEENDVAIEKERIHNTSINQLTSENMIVLKDITKYYWGFLAVNGLNLSIKKYECFGLLGINGAGKTTTFKMMTGDIPITYGNGWVNKYSIKTQIKSVHKMIGYCPQFDALLDDMTAKETLYMFSLIRGIPREDCYDLSEMLSKKFDFHRHIRKKVKQMSGGNKRKLSASITLLGDPPVIYFDEPTAGMDPATRRYFWNAVCEMRDRGKCIVLTSHSMEECEALCTRLAIMVNGNFKCLGSTQHLKNKFAAGYTLTIKMKTDGQTYDVQFIEQFIKNKFPTAILKEKHQELLTYFIADKRLTLSRMFGTLEQNKSNLNIEDYSLGQASLEQVFLSFTKYQQ